VSTGVSKVGARRMALRLQVKQKKISVENKAHTPSSRLPPLPEAEFMNVQLR
jgi:hypothetical protein